MQNLLIKTAILSTLLGLLLAPGASAQSLGVDLKASASADTSGATSAVDGLKSTATGAVGDAKAKLDAAKGEAQAQVEAAAGAAQAHAEASASAGAAFLHGAAEKIQGAFESIASFANGIGAEIKGAVDVHVG